jgi:hypothetical protein
MARTINTGDRFGLLTAIRFERRDIRRHAHWLFKCDCGVEKIIEAAHVLSGDNTGCGCQRTKHGLHRAPEYHIWKAMIRRCTAPTQVGYHRYGGRGIRVCDRWRASVEDFLADVGRRPSPDHTLDRIDNDGNYEPGNVRWVAMTVQQRNRRDNRIVEFRGVPMTLTEACALAGVDRRTAHGRIKRGWDIGRALTP